MSTKMEDTKDSTAQMLYNYTQETTLHAVSHITDKSRGVSRRVTWFVVFLAMNALFVYIVYNSLVTFFSYPVATKVERIPIKSMDFPSVTMCNFNIINITYAYAQNETVRAVLESLTMWAQWVPLNLSDPDILAAMKYLDLESMAQTASHDFKESFTSCSFNSDNHSAWPCRYDDYGLFVRTVTKMGYCYTFHPESYIKENGPLQVTRPGSNGGLVLEVNLFQDLYYYFSGGSAGMKVLVHDPHVQPMVDEMGIRVSPGFETDIIIKRTEIVNLPPPLPGSTCVDTLSEKFVNPLKYYDYYSETACELECQVDYVIDKCGCKTYQQYARNVSTCSFYDMFSCADEAYNEYFKLDDDTKNCSCFRECYRNEYDVTSSVAYYPNNVVAHVLSAVHHIDKEYCRRNCIKLNIFFDSLSYTSVLQERAYPIESALSELGGMMGLCLGASILSISEVIEVIIMVFYKLFCKKPRSSTKVQAFEQEQKNMSNAFTTQY